MILSSADIARILGANEIIRLSAKVQIVDRKPPLSGREGAYIYINRFPALGEFEATWQIWIECDDDCDLIIAELRRTLPKVQVTDGLMTTVTTTEFRSENTQQAPVAAAAPKADLTELKALEARLEALIEDVQDQMLLVTSGRNGKDGQDGAPGAPGRDGRDLVATEAELEDLQNVESNIPKENGQVLTWKDGVWQNLFIPQVVSSISGKGGSSGGGGGGTSSVIVSDTAPTERVDSTPLEEGDLWWESDTALLYVYYNGAWVHAGTNTVASVIISDTAPTSRPVGAPLEEGDLWWESDTNLLYAYYGGTWIQIGGTGGGVPEAPIDGTAYVRQNAAWVPNTSLPPDLGNAVLNDLGDVNAPTANAGEALIYNGSEWAPGGDFHGGSF